MDRSASHWPLGVKYEIFVRSFADANKDGIGDLNGITAKLDYLEDLGIGGIWVTPIMKSPSYHKYDVVDYKSVDPEYGTPEDFKSMVKDAHQRGIKVIIDLVVNHTSNRHPWFTNAVKGKDNPYRDYYVWADPDSVREKISKKSISLDSDNLTQWHAVKGDTSGQLYYGFFSSVMPDLNFDNPKVRNEFVEIGKYWLVEMGADGFRLDAARYIYPREREEDNHKFWIWFRTEMEKFKPDVYLVGEVWTTAEEVAPYLRGLNSAFNFDLASYISTAARTGKSTVVKDSTVTFIEWYSKIQNHYRAASTNYLDATILSNHDQDRILTQLENQVDKARVAAGILLTLPGTPYLYYGEEIGMKGKKPDEGIREPFLWDTGVNDPLQTRWEEPVYSTDKTVKPLALQKADKSSLYSFYKSLIRYRNSSVVLSNGSLEGDASGSLDYIVFQRKLGEEKVLVCHNISDVEIAVNLREYYPDFTNIDFDFYETASITEASLLLPAYSTVILK